MTEVERLRCSAAHVMATAILRIWPEAQFAASYVRVKTTHIAKDKIYKTSGHRPYYAESIFPPMGLDERREERKKPEARLAELERQLQEYTKKIPPNR